MSEEQCAASSGKQWQLWPNSGKGGRGEEGDGARTTPRRSTTLLIVARSTLSSMCLWYRALGGGGAPSGWYNIAHSCSP